MELADLDKTERVALAGLLEYVILASGQVTADEQREIDTIIDAIGEEAYQAAMDEVDTHFKDEKGLRDFLKTITREEAREVIGISLDLLNRQIPENELQATRSKNSLR